MATISTLFYNHLWVWPIVMLVTYGSCRKYIDNFGVYILSYLLNVSIKSLHSFFVGKVI